MGFQQDLEVLGLPPSPVEVGRLQRAFCRFETLRRFLGTSSNESNYNQCHRLNEGRQLLTFLELGGEEEVACVRHFLVRRLWGCLKQSRTMLCNRKHRAQSGERRERLTAIIGFHHVPSCAIWIAWMTLGFPFLVFESRGLERADLIISNSVVRKQGITAVLNCIYGPS